MKKGCIYVVMDVESRRCLALGEDEYDFSEKAELFLNGGSFFSGFRKINIKYRTFEFNGHKCVVVYYVGASVKEHGLCVTEYGVRLGIPCFVDPIEDDFAFDHELETCLVGCGFKFS